MTVASHSRTTIIASSPPVSLALSLPLRASILIRYCLNAMQFSRGIDIRFSSEWRFTPSLVGSFSSVGSLTKAVSIVKMVMVRAFFVYCLFATLFFAFVLADGDSTPGVECVGEDCEEQPKLVC